MKGDFLKAMKTMKKLIPALAMLLVSAVLLGTSTFAWFSMNTTVTATNMQVVAKSNNTFLLINTGDNDTATEIQSANVTTIPLTVSNEDAKVFPSRPCLTAEDAALLPATTGKKVGGAAITVAGAQVTNTATASAVTNWYTATAADSGASTKASGSERQLESFTNYVIVRTAYLTVSVGATKVNNLTVTPTITQKTSGADISAVKLLVVTDDGGFAAITSANNAQAIDIKGSNTDITDSTVRTVTIYMYYDGEESVVYTNNMANLKGCDISLQFDVEVNP